jgi:lipopolysaccharide transport system ATP-binding protein
LNSMQKPIISVRGLSKKFILNHEGKEQYTALRDVITSKALNLFKSETGNVKAKGKEEFWALKDVDFDIKPGDRVGIIGRNGAGKSTLLKVLSRITEPTHGRITVRGRISSLLEVGTGFHPELTGRENIFLNGAILGMSNNEIRRKFDQIVEFAEVEQFLDTPVKRYSSGMYVRLAFAVAAHLEPEVLVVDEVLAVGDAQFQKKCLGKMEEVSKNEGRTVLFVSHNMIAIQQLCNDIIVLNKGNLIFHGDRAKGMIEYEKLNSRFITDPLSNENSIEFKLSSGDRINPETLESNAPLRFSINVFSRKNYGKSWVNVIIDNSDGVTVGHIRNDWYNQALFIREGENRIEIEVSDISLVPNIYTIWVRMAFTEDLIVLDSSPLYVEVTGKHIYGKVAYTTSWKIN